MGKGQAALEYLMTYGWVLMMIAIVVGVAIYVMGDFTGGATFISNNSGLLVKESTYTTGTNTIGLTLQNMTGGTITNITVTDYGNGIMDQAGDATATPTTAENGQTFTITNLDSNTPTLTDAYIEISYTTTGGLPVKAKITGNGTANTTTGTILSTSATACYNFNEGTGTTISEGCGGNSGTIFDANWTTGKSGNALEFDGEDDWARATNLPEIAVDRNFTVSVWVYPDDSPSPGQMVIFQNSHGTADRVGMNIEEDDKIKFGYYDGSWRSKSSDPITELGGYGQWYHVVGVVADGSRYLYVNGVEQTGTAQVYVSSHANYMYIGSIANTSDYWDGKIDELKVWDRALSEAEILALYSG